LKHYFKTIENYCN